MLQTVDKTGVTLTLSVVASLCALASLKQERGDLLIKSVPDIERELRRFIDKKLIGAIKDGMGGNVGDLFYRINEFGQGSIEPDEYGKSMLVIDGKARLLFQEFIADDLRFGSQEVHDAILRISDFLGASEVLNEVAKKIDDKIGRFEFFKSRYFDKPEYFAHSRMLAVLIPLACVSAYDKLAVYEGTPELVAQHQSNCRYCKKYFELLDVVL